MALVSPGVEIREISAGGSIQQLSSTSGAIVLSADWGPVNKRVSITKEQNLVSTFGEPNSDNVRQWLTAANFLSYVGSLYAVRAVDDGSALNAVDTGSGILVENEDDFETVSMSGYKFVARYPGEFGNSIKVEVCDDGSVFDGWSLSGEFDAAPDTSDYAAEFGASKDELHVAVIDEDGVLTGTKGSVLETFAFLSKASDAKNETGGNNYWLDVINQTSEYVYVGDEDLSTAQVGESSYGDTAVEAGSLSQNFAFTNSIQEYSLSGGVTANATAGQLATALQKNFESKEDVVFRYIITADGGESVGATTHVLVDQAISIAESRKDCVVLVSPMTLGNTGAPVTDKRSAVDAFISGLTRSSYVIVDSGYKQQYNKYDDKQHWVPLNGDTAGINALTDLNYDPWISPAGFTKGQVRNVTKLAWNPKQSDRDYLYKLGINPVVNFPGRGTILYGDKTFLAKPNAFDRINVRKLFITIEENISSYAEGLLFDPNDSFTRTQFIETVRQYLNRVQERRGIEAKEVQADPDKNTGTQFVGDIFVRPVDSINFIRLNFVAVRDGVSFNEIAG